ncbi:MAG: TetR/AcrR family transcriptional regulator [Chloroflexota bacterium]
MQKEIGRKRRRSQRSIQTEKALLDHAKRIISEHGFEHTTTKDIALAAQVAEGTLFHHFPNKMALLEGLMIDYYERLQASAEEIGRGDLSDSSKLRALLLNHLERAKQEWGILRVVAQYGRYGDREFADKFYQLNKNYIRLFVDVIDNLKADMQIRRSTPTPLIRDTLFGSMEHFMIGHYNRNRPYDLDKFVDQLLDLVMFGAGGK